MKSPATTLCTLLCLLLAAGSTRALDIHLQGDRLSLNAQDDALSDILDYLVHTGVDVQMDPTIEARVSGQLEDVDVQEALDEILGPFSYALMWDVVEGPMGALPKLSVVRIFKPDAGQDGLRSLPQPDGNLAVTRGPLPDGPLFVQDELLISVRAGTRLEDFKRLMREIGGTVVDSVPHLGIYKIRIPPGTNVLALMQQLRQRKMFANVEPNYVFKAPVPVPVGGNGAWPGGEPDVLPAPAEGVPPVAILDSGLVPVAGVGNYVVGGLDALNPDRTLTDRSGHGTQMALIASGLIRPLGVPEGEGRASVPVLAIRAFDDRGYASNFSIMNSINYAANHGARVLSMSWGTSEDSVFLRRAIRDAQRRGMVVVASAGNVPHGQPVYPAAYPGVVAVSALDRDGTLWDKSNYGDMVFAAAPGRADFPIGHKGPPGSYAGTSIGTPYVARELSMYMARHPDASSRDAVNAFREVLTERGESGKDPKYGYGAFDVDAVRRLRSL